MKRMLLTRNSPVREEIQHTSFVRTLSAVFSDAGLLLRQELELAKGELASILSEQMRSAAFFALAALLFFVGLLLLCQSAIFALVERGVRPSLAALALALAVFVIAGILAMFARSKIRPLPDRTISSLKRDVEVAKETFK